jgi:hypothetical protein
MMTFSLLLAVVGFNVKWPPSNGEIVGCERRLEPAIAASIRGEQGLAGAPLASHHQRSNQHAQRMFDPGSLPYATFLAAEPLSGEFSGAKPEYSRGSWGADLGLRKRDDRQNLSPNSDFSPRPGTTRILVSSPSTLNHDIHWCAYAPTVANSVSPAAGDSERNLRPGPGARRSTSQKWLKPVVVFVSCDHRPIGPPTSRSQSWITAR